MRWMEARRPRPPADLGARLRGELMRSGAETDVVERLLVAAGAALEHSLRQPGRVRAAAFDLLAADALVTYACEAALEGDSADAALERLVSIGGGP